MTTAKLKEIRPALWLTHKTREACEQSLTTQRWIEWADRHRFAWHIGRREYYNLPSTTEMESYDYEPKESRFYWELHVMADDSAFRPESLYMGPHYTLDEAIEMTQKMVAFREVKQTAARERLDRNMADLAEILPAWLPMGTLLMDEIYKAGGRSREIYEAVQDGLISQAKLREAILAIRNV